MAVILDYGIYSLSNLVLGLSVARAANLEIYGIFGLLFLFENFCLVMVRAMVGEAWLVSSETGDRDSKARNVPTGWALIIGFGLVPPLLIVAALTDVASNHWGLVMAMTLVLPAVLSQDAHRFVCYDDRRPWRAVGSDASWLISQLVLLACMATGILPFSAVWAACAWALGAFVGLVTIGAVKELRPRSIAAGFGWWNTHRRVGQHLAVEALGSSMVGPVLAMGLVLMSQEVTLGVLRGAATLFSPILVFSQGMRTALTRQIDRKGRILGARILLSATSLGWGTLLTMAPRIGAVMLGGLWGPPIQKIVLLEAMARVGLASASIDSAVLRSRSATSAAAGLGLLTGILVVAVVLLGAFLNGFFGAAIGAAISYGVGAIAWRLYLCRRWEPSSV